MRDPKFALSSVFSPQASFTRLIFTSPLLTVDLPNYPGMPPLGVFVWYARELDSVIRL